MGPKKDRTTHTGPELPANELAGVESEVQSVMAAGSNRVARGATVVDNNNNNNTNETAGDVASEEESEDPPSESLPQPSVTTPHPEPPPAGVGNHRPGPSRSGATTGPPGAFRSVSAAGGVTRTGVSVEAESEGSDDDYGGDDDPRSRSNRLAQIADQDRPVVETYGETWQVTVIAFMNALHYGKTPSVAKKWIRSITPYDLQELLKKVANFCVHGPHGVGAGGTAESPKRDYALSDMYPGLTNMILKEIGYVMAEVYINRGGLPRDAWFMRVNGGNLWPYSADDDSGKGNAEHRRALAERNPRRRASNA